MPGSDTPSGAAASDASARSRSSSLRSATRIARRTGWGMADQVLSAGSNFALSVVVAELVSLADFGRFSILFAVYVMAQGVVRGLVGSPYLVLYRRAEGAEQERFRQGALGSASILGTVVGAACVVAGAVVDLVGEQALGRALVVLGLSMPGLLLHEACRFALFGERRTARAVPADLAWVVMQFVALGAIWAWVTNPPLWLVVAGWSVAGALAAPIAVVLVGTTPSVRAARRWWTDHRFFSMRLLGEEVASRAAVQLPAFFLGGVAGLDELGRFRSAALLRGPLTLLSFAVPTIAVPEMVRWYHGRRPDLLRAAVGVTALGLVVGGLVWFGALLAFPDVAERFIGTLYERGRSLLPLVVLRQTTVSVYTSVLAGLRAVEDVKTVWRCRLYELGLALVFATVGGALWGAEGALIGLTAKTVLITAYAWRTFRSDIRAIGVPSDATPRKPVGAAE